MSNILKPDVVWIEGRCYRLNDSQTDMNLFQEHDLYDNETTYHEEEDDGDNGTEVMMMDNNRFYINLHISKHYLGAIIGKKGAVKMRIERDTKTDIKIPRQGENKDITIYGPSPTNVKAAKRKINMIVMSSRMKQRPTHFISIPTNQPTIVTKFERFKEDVLMNCKGVDESLFIAATKLHVTVGVMCLMDAEERATAAKILTDARETIIMPRIREHAPFAVRVRGLSYMNDEPRATHVVYARVDEADAPPGTLQTLVDELSGLYCRAGLMKREFDRDNVKMHVTLMNSKYRKRAETDASAGDAGRFEKREPFDASEILARYSDYEFGVVELAEVHLSQRKSMGADGFYQATCVVTLK